MVRRSKLGHEAVPVGRIVIVADERRAIQRGAGRDEDVGARERVSRAQEELEDPHVCGREPKP